MEEVLPRGRIRGGGGVSGLAWHYTIGLRWEEIDSCGLLRPATALVKARERPAVWFTLRDTFEPTAVKLLQAPDGTLRSMPIEETERRGRGLFRIGVDPSKLLTWEEWRRRSRVRPAVAESLETVASDQGSDVAEWLVSFRPLPRDEWQAVEVRFRREWSPIPSALEVAGEG